mgnify:FL=1
MEASDSQLLYHSSCSSCGSSDANAIYASGTAYCFSCGNWSVVDNSICNNRRTQTMRDDLLNGEAKALKARGIPANICSQYNYKIGVDNKGNSCQIATYYNKDKQPVAQKLRYKDKTFKFIGENKEALLYGQHLWSSGGKKLTITEGEIDALSVAVAFDGKYPVVSIPNGAQGAKKAITKSLEWVTSFEEIYLWFDNDAPGLQAIEEVLDILPIGKVKIIRHEEYKDASDVLINVGKSGVVNTFYNAESYKPDGFISPIDILEDVIKPIEWGIPWLYEKLNKVSYGRRYGEVVAIGAGVSVGKTDFLMQQIAEDLKNKHHVATFMLEQSKVETLQRIAGKIDGTFYHLPDVEYDVEKLKTTVTNLNNLHIYDNFGKIDWETIKSKIRAAVHSFDCRIFYIDNLTALNAHADDERRNLDGLMEEIASLTKELNIWILLVSHLNPPKSGASHEAGGKVEQGQFTGSRAIMRWCQFMLGIERNTLHEDPKERCKGLVRCIKDRFSGKATGQTIGFVYDTETGMTLEADDIKQLEMFDEEEDY